MLEANRLSRRIAGNRLPNAQERAAVDDHVDLVGAEADRAPHVVELDVTAQLHEHAAKLRGELASLDEELALTYTYPCKEQSDAGA